MASSLQSATQLIYTGPSAFVNHHCLHRYQAIVLTMAGHPLRSPNGCWPSCRNLESE